MMVDKKLISTEVTIICYMFYYVSEAVKEITAIPDGVKTESFSDTSSLSLFYVTGSRLVNESGFSGNILYWCPH